MSAPTLRNARSEDAEDIATVFALACQLAYQRIFPPELVARYSPERQYGRWIKYLKSLPDGHSIIVADDGEHVIGFTDVGPATAHPNIDPAAGEVHYLFVHPQYTGRGIGFRLLRAGEQFLARNNFKYAILWVFCDNLPAKIFYERRCWKPVGIEGIEPDLYNLGYSIGECVYGRRLLPDNPVG